MTRSTGRIPTKAISVLVAMVVVPVVAGCGAAESSDAAKAQKSPYAANGSANPSVMVNAPADYQSIAGVGFSIGSPTEFQEQRETSSNGQPMLILQKPSGIDALPQRVVVIRDVDPQQSVAQQSFALEAEKSAGGPSGKAKRIQVTAPKGQAAYLITWQEKRPTQGSSNTEVTYWQLMWQVNRKLILNVVALAPTEQFATSEVSKMLRTFKPKDS